MDIHFEVVEKRPANPADHRATAFPEGSDVTILRLRPVADDHVAAVGDIVLAALTSDVAKLVARVDEQPAVPYESPPGTIKVKAAIVGVAGSGCTLTL